MLKKVKPAYKQLLLSCLLLVASLYFPWGVLGEYSGMLQGAVTLAAIFGLLAAMDKIDKGDKKK